MQRPQVMSFPSAGGGFGVVLGGVLGSGPGPPGCTGGSILTTTPLGPGSSAAGAELAAHSPKTAANASAAANTAFLIMRGVISSLSGSRGRRRGVWRRDVRLPQEAEGETEL